MPTDYPRDIRDVAVYVEPRPRTTHVTLRYAAPCEHCGTIHQHGNHQAEPDPDGTFGLRVPHCPSVDRKGRKIETPSFTARLIPADGATC